MPPGGTARTGWNGLPPGANKSSGFLVRSPERLAIGCHPYLGPPNLPDPSQSREGEEHSSPIPGALGTEAGAGGCGAGGGDWRCQPASPPDAVRRVLHHGARRVAGRVRATLPSLGPREGAGVCAHPPALGVRVPLPLAAVAHLRRLLLRARLGGVQAQ